MILGQPEDEAERAEEQRRLEARQTAREQRNRRIAAEYAAGADPRVLARKYKLGRGGAAAVVRMADDAS